MSSAKKGEIQRRFWGNNPRPAAVLAGLVLSASLLVASRSATAASGLALATAAEWTDSAGSANALVVHFDRVPQYYARLSNDKLRLIVDVSQSGVAGAPPLLTSAAGAISGVMIQGFARPQATTRVIVTLRKAAEYSVRAVGNDLRIDVGEAAKAVGGVNTTSTKQEPSTAKQVAKKSDALLELKDVQFERHGFEDRIQLLSADETVLQTARVKQSALRSGETRFTITRANIARELERTLDVRAFQGCVSSISSYRGGEKSVVVDVEHCDDARVQLEQQATGTWIRFIDRNAPTTATGVASDGGAARKTHTLHREESPEAATTGISASELAPLSGELSAQASTQGETLSAELAPATQSVQASNPGDSASTKSEQASSDAPLEQRSVEPARAAGFAPAILGQMGGRYSGRRIDMDFKDADIHNVLRLLADAGHVNIVAADNVTGSVTIRMRNVPWDQAIDVVLQAKNLGMDRQGNIIRVAPLADLEKEREMAIARRAQELQLAPIETRLIPVSYAHAADIQARAGDLLSGRGTIAVDDRTNVMIVRDVAANLDQIEELTRSLDTQTPQVLIEARIVEATSRYLREVGVQWGGDASFSAATGNPTGLIFPNAIGLAGGASDQDTPTGGLSPFQNSIQNPNFAVNLPVATGTGKGGAIGLTFGSVNSNFNLSLRLSAAETSGMLRILSSPRVLTLDNQQARISQGTLIPFSQVSAQGVQTTFQEAKLQLLVKPHVTADGSVSMHVKINRDEPDFNQKSPRGDPTILKREAETELLVADGHTAVIGGIFTRNTGRNVDQVPFFGDIPLLGLLFQKRSASDTRGELVIFLTPRIVNRAEALGR